METHKNQKPYSHPNRFTYKTKPIRQHLMHIPQVLCQFDQLIGSIQNSIHNNLQTITNYQQSLKTIVSSLKLCIFEPSKWLSSSVLQQKESRFLFQHKLFQLNQMFNTLSTNSLLIDSLIQYKTNSIWMVDFQKLPIGNTKKQLLLGYKEAYDYYRCKKCLNKFKDKVKLSQLLKMNPQINECEQVKIQVQQMKNRELLLQRICNKFKQIEERLIGFNVSNKQLNCFEQIESKMQKILKYINQSSTHKETNRISPQNVKEFNQIIQILSLFSNSNVGLLQDKIVHIENNQIKQVSNKVVENLIKKQKLAQQIYDFLIANLDDKNRYRFSKSNKHLSLDRKLNQCVKLIKQFKKSGILLKNKQEDDSNKAQLNKQVQQNAKQQAIMNIKLQSDMKLLLAQQQIYSLQIKSNSLIEQNKQLKVQMQHKLQTFQSQKSLFQQKINKIQQEYKQIQANNKSLTIQLQKSRINNSRISSQLTNKQSQINAIKQSIVTLTNKINQIVEQKQNVILQYYHKIEKFRIDSKVVQLAIIPQNLCINSLLQNFNFTQGINHSQNGSHSKDKEPLSPIHKKLKRHFRSQSNVDLLSELMPDIIQEYSQKLEETTQIQQLKKGIQLRERTIKKYEAYVDKQRKQAKKNRSQILQLQSKVRSLELQQIKFKQTLQDQSSDKFLIIDEDYSAQRIQSPQKIEQTGSLQKISEKQVQLKVKEEQLNFKIQQIIKHVLKLNTLRVNSNNYTNQSESIENVLEDPQLTHQQEIQ